MNILVEDPDEVYAGESTTCVSTGETFDGCPSGARQVVTNDLAAAVGFLGAGRRVLLRRGDRWPHEGTLAVQGAGPMTLGAFGECTGPTRLGVCTNAPVLEAAGTANESFLGLRAVDDLRLVDLSFEDPNGVRREAIGGVTNIHGVLMLRLRTRGFKTPFLFSHWESPDPEGNALVECDVADTRDMVVYLGGVRLGLLGNDLRDSNQTHVLRVWQAHRAVIQHNELSGSSVGADSGRHALKLHGPDESTIASTDSLHLAFRTRYVIVSQNVFGASGPWPVTIEPQNGEKDERLEDVLFEGNRILPSFGRQNSMGVSIGLNLWGRHFTVRNNVFTAHGANPNDFRAVALDRYADTALPVPEAIRIFHNTIVISEPGVNQNGTGVVLFGTANDVQLANNLVVMPGEYPLMLGTGQDVVIGENLVTPDAGLVDLSGDNPLSWDFSLDVGSPAIDSANAVPVLDDYAGNPRPAGSGFDFGAFERQ